jgi:spermidine/putrescine transport system ATP-binding protein
VGSPRELYHNPATPFVASFVGETNRWQGQGASATDGTIAVKLPSGAIIQGHGAASASALAFVRPEAIALAQDQAALSSLPNRFAGQVSAVLFDGANSSLLIQALGFDEPVRAVLSQAGPLAGIRVGEPIHVGWAAEAMKVFAA